MKCKIEKPGKQLAILTLRWYIILCTCTHQKTPSKVILIGVNFRYLLAKPIVIEPHFKGYSANNMFME